MDSDAQRPINMQIRLKIGILLDRRDFRHHSMVLVIENMAVEKKRALDRRVAEVHQQQK